MVETYLQPVVDSLWTGEAVGADTAESTVATCDHLLSSMDATERNTTRWQVLTFSLPCVLSSLTPVSVDSCHRGHSTTNPKAIAILLQGGCSLSSCRCVHVRFVFCGLLAAAV